MNILPIEEVNIKCEISTANTLTEISYFLELKVKQEETCTFKFSSQQIKAETLDMNIKTESYTEEINIKLEPSLNIKNEVLFSVRKFFEPDTFFICNICTYKTKYRSNIKRHRTTHSGEKPFSCLEYKFNTVSKRSLQRHMQVRLELKLPKIPKVEKRFVCTECKFRTGRKRSLRRHMPTHSITALNLEIFECNDCEYKCYEKQNLIRHVKIHTGEKDFGCPNCNCCTSWKRNLENHMLTHTGEKPFKCDYCEYRVIRHSHLKRHSMMKHTGEKPFKCSTCEYRTAQKCELRQHRMIHTGEKPFMCEQCGFRTAHKRNLRSHLKNHNNLQLHMKIHTKT